MKKTSEETDIRDIGSLTGLECSVIVRRGDELVRVSPHQNKEEECDLLYEPLFAVPGGFPFEVTLPRLVTTRGIRRI